jgi:hypothetical protein
MTTGSDWNFKPIVPEPRDRSLSGGTFVAYQIFIESGVRIDQKSKRFFLAGPSSPSLDELWSQFTPLPQSAMASKIEAFIAFLRTQGFVELEGTIAIGLSY